MHGFVKRVSQKVSKLSSDQIEQLFTSMNDENETFNSIFESLATGLLIVDKSFFILQNNKASERYLPFKTHPEESKADEIPVWNLIDDEDIAEFLHTCYINDRTNVCSEFTISTSTGAARFITITLLPLVKQYDATGTIISIADITEKRSQEVLLHRMENLASLTNLAASVAHEIKNPLGAISIHIQLIQKALKKARAESDQLPEKKFVDDHLDVVNEEIDNLNKIVVDFLFAVRPITVNPELLNPNKLIKRFTEIYKAEFEQNGILMSADLCNDETRLMIDEKLFRDVINNIVQNSIAAIKERSADLDMAVASGYKGKFNMNSMIKDDHYVLVISDNGIGMSEKTVSHIFEPYYTTKPNGTGLGMTMVYKIIKEFSGDIAVSSTRGKGSQFTITLPIPQTKTCLLAHDGKSENSPAIKMEDKI